MAEMKCKRLLGVRSNRFVRNVKWWLLNFWIRHSAIFGFTEKEGLPIKLMGKLAYRYCYPGKSLSVLRDRRILFRFLTD